MLIDTHAHVQMRQFASDREQVVRAAFATGVTRLIVPGTDVPTSEDAIALAERFPGQVFAAVGTHPHDAATLTDEAFARQRTLMRHPHVVAVGEIGLDFYRNLSPREAQLGALQRQCALAIELDLPVILHNRDSHHELIAALREAGPALRGVFHCFIGDRQMAQDALDLGFYLSFAGPVTYPANTTLADVAGWAPEDRILVETDCPYLTPVPFRGKRNEPKHIALTAQRVADLRGIALDRLAQITTANATALFRLPPLHAQE